MFDLDASKIVIVGVAALIFIPPKDLPRVMRQVGQFVGKMRRMAGEFQGQFMDAMREADMADLRAEARKLSDAARVDTGLGTIRDLDQHMRPLPSPPPIVPAFDSVSTPPVGGAPVAATEEPVHAERQAAIERPAAEPQHLS